MEKQVIEISKNIYNNQQYKQVIDVSFSELKQDKEPLSLDKFFKDFDDIFLNIPTEGNQSIRSIFNRVDSVLNELETNPKDIEIDNLLSQIEELQQKIDALQSSNDEETHPQFDNGKLLLNATEASKKYVMERGKKRQIMDGDTQKVLIQLNGGRADTSFQEVAIQLPPSIINGITDGIPINESNFNLSESTIDEDIQKEIWNKDWSDPSLNLNWVKNQYSYDEYLEVLSKDLEQKEAVIEYVEDQIDLRRNHLSQLKFADDDQRKEELRNEISDLNSTLESVETRESEVSTALISLLNNPNLWDEAESSQSQPIGDNPSLRFGILKKNLEKLFEGGFLDKNAIGPLEDGLKEAKRERSDNPRPQQRWIADIEKKNSGTKQRDLLLVVEKTVDRLREDPNSNGLILQL